MSNKLADGTNILKRQIEYTPPRSWRTWLMGRPLSTADAPHQTIGKVIGLAVFASDALSSTAYATQEMMVILVLAGTAALQLSIPLSFVIVALLTILTISYEQTIHAYSGGGGAYIVARDNIGMKPALVAAGALINGLHPDSFGFNFFGRCTNCICNTGFICLPRTNCCFFCIICHAD